jgi:hypothetical protein
LQAEIQKVGTAFGSEATNVNIATESIDGREAFLSRFNLVQNGRPLSFIQAVVPGVNQTYVVTCTCDRADSVRCEPIFQAMIASLKVDQGVSAIPGTVIYTLIGALIGGGIGLAIRNFRGR